MNVLLQRFPHDLIVYSLIMNYFRFIFSCVDFFPIFFVLLLHQEEVANEMCSIQLIYFKLKHIETICSIRKG